MIRAFLRWLADFPRPTWVVRTDEGQFVYLRRAEARRDMEAMHDIVKAIDRGPWSRPSEVEHLPEM